jgi:hypothetical protein
LLIINILKIYKNAVLFCLCLLITACKGNQTVIGETANNLSAKEILKRTVTASGGDTWQQPNTLLLRGVATFTPHGKTDSLLHFDKYAMYRIFPAENNAAHQANGKVRFDAFYGQNSFFELKFDGKKSKMLMSDRAKPYSKHFNWSNNFGFGIIRFADRDNFRVTRLTDDQVEGYPCYMVQITDPNKTITTFGIDKKTFYIRLVAFTTDVGYHHRIYSNFKKATNLSFIQPTRVRLYFDGVKWMDINWQEFKVNERIEDKVFE